MLKKVFKLFKEKFGEKKAEQTLEKLEEKTEKEMAPLTTSEKEEPSPNRRSKSSKMVKRGAKRMRRLNAHQKKSANYSKHW